MKFATVIDVGQGAQALQHALHTQSLMLEQLGSRLDSIRLAVPRLMPHACAGAVTEEPDVLVIAGGPRSARIAGQLAHERHIPILFLPAFQALDWGKRLWGGLSLEDMVKALASGAVERVMLGAGSAGGQLFFDSASCGLLPNLAALRRARHSETLVEAHEAVSRAASLSRLIWRPRMSFGADRSASRRITAVSLRVQHGTSAGAWGERPSPPFVCKSWNHGWIGHIGAAMATSLGANWRHTGHAQRFACVEASIDSTQPLWLVLDEDPLRLTGPVQFRFVPDAIQTFAFRLRDVANDNNVQRRARFADFSLPPESGWNSPTSSRVANRDGRASGGGKSG